MTNIFLWLHLCNITLPHHHTGDISESIELLKCLSSTFCLECVSKMTSILSTIFLTIYEDVRIQLTNFFYDDFENMCTLFCYHHQIGCMTHLPLFRVKSWNNVMHCMSFYILILMSNFVGDDTTLDLVVEGSPEVTLVGGSNPEACLNVTNQFVYEVCSFKYYNDVLWYHCVFRLWSHRLLDCWPLLLRNLTRD